MVNMKVVRRSGGVFDFIAKYAINNFGPAWKFFNRYQWFTRLNTCVLIRYFIKTVPRMNHYSLKNDFASYESLYDESRSYYARVVPPHKEYGEKLNKQDPNADLATKCFVRDNFKEEPNQHLSLLMGYYAQWFSHQFFNTVPQTTVGDSDEWDYSETYRSSQPVGLNLSQLYGSLYENHKEDAKFGTLTEKSLRTMKNGELKSSIINNDKVNEFPYIVDANSEDRDVTKFPFWSHNNSDGGKKDEAFLMPIVLANMIPGFAGIQTLFLRHHNYVARELKNANPSWDDEKLFQISKLITMFTVLKITMHDYVGNGLQTSYPNINFDAGLKDSIFYKLFVPKTFESINAIQAEFNFLYRWHQFYPNEIRVLKDLNGGNVFDNNTNFNRLTFPDIPKLELYQWNSVDYYKGNINEWDYGDGNKNGDNALELLLLSSSQTPAGQLTLKNTHPWLANHVVRSGLLKTRHYGLASYNDYREYFGLARMRSFDEISSDPEIIKALKNAYASVDDIEFYTGVFAEDKDFNGIHGSFLSTIGVGFTFSGIFASRLFNTNVINEKLLSNKGMELVEQVNYVRDLVRLHTKLGDVYSNSQLWKQITFKMNQENLNFYANRNK